MKIFSKFLILLLTVVSVFSIKYVSADTPDIVIKDMSISEKSETIAIQIICLVPPLRNSQCF